MRFSAVAFTLALCSQFSFSLAHSSSSLNQLQKRVTLVDPAVSTDFGSISTSEPSCSNPCKNIINLSNCTSTDTTCVYNALCTETGLNALVQCNNCILKIANRTTGVSAALYSNVSSILTTTEATCSQDSYSANATTAILSWSAFYPNNATASSVTTSSTTSSPVASSSSGIGAAAAAAKSGAGKRMAGSFAMGGLIGGVVALGLLF